MKNNWDLIDLKVLCAVAHRSSFTAAASDLGISVAYVTKRVAHLEQVLGTSMFLRTTRRVHITAQGEIVYSWARRVLDAAEEMDQEVVQSRLSPVGTLRLSTSLRLGRVHISHILALLRRQYPQLDIWLELVDRRVDLIAEGFDMDIRVGNIQEPHLIAQRIAASPRILCASPSYIEERGQPKTLAELPLYDCLMFRDRGQSFDVLHMVGPNGQETIKVTGSMGSNQGDVVRDWAVHGLGITLLSRWDLAPLLRDGQLKRVLPQYEQPADIFAVMPTRSSYSAKLQICLEFLRQQLASGPYALDSYMD
ncbi:LysR substrate-binding domain-containing protein [Telmatospirillum sp.]|uniref:LysR substrate-binding domain-containing protein n=1 Tax=Telmatospirillum sp. TaxID=2079197 RepID=UPI002841F305|nr:LysR substrate-binding domain-containing protein [Telmatospirillum sp.]MDR3439343.1 LysR substrate-binding domain-containing protein [Telmatospirillum sp.]